MAVDYDEGRRLFEAWTKTREQYQLDYADREYAFRNVDYQDVQWRQSDWLRWTETHAEALLNPDPWRPIEEADKGCGKYRGPSYATWHPKRNGWCRGCWNPRYHASKAEGYWQTDGGSITQDRDDPPTHFRDLKGPGQ